MLEFVFAFKLLPYENNRNREATIKMFIAQINLLSFGTSFKIVASIVFGQYFFAKHLEIHQFKRQRHWVKSGYVLWLYILYTGAWSSVLTLHVNAS